jgi:hypothetical protein
MKSAIVVCGIVLVFVGLSGQGIAGSLKEAQDQAQAMARDGDDMIMHGGMGDAKAIVHHCQEATRHAEAIVKLLPATDSHSKEALVQLQDIVRYCQRVSALGDHVDPGVLLNPATKARTAIQEVVRQLSSMN